MDKGKSKKKTSNEFKNKDNYKNDSGHGTSSDCPTDTMTSREFQYDTSARIEMMNQTLKDSVRIESFKSAILHNKHLFRNKIVLDVGCGVGLLSLFSAKAGAKKVYAIDSSNVIYYTRKIIKANKFDEVIEVFKGKVEEIELPVQKVDIIVSDWMGYALLYESACADVIYARDKWLKSPGGLIFPDKGKLFMVGVEDVKHKNENIDWWKDVYGFNMTCIRSFALREPRFKLLKPQQILSKQCAIKSLNLQTASIEDLRLRNKYLFEIQRSGRMDAIALYFHVYFSNTHIPVGFSTDPWSAGTNWMQTLFFFDQSLTVNKDARYYGGIELYSPCKPGDMTEMIVNLEMLMGEPSHPDIEMHMHWRLKPVLAATEIKKIETNNLVATVNSGSSLKTENQVATADAVVDNNDNNNISNRDITYVFPMKTMEHLNAKKEEKSAIQNFAKTINWPKNYVSKIINENRDRQPTAKREVIFEIGSDTFVCHRKSRSKRALKTTKTQKKG